jgi:hypothetical protein
MATTLPEESATHLVVAIGHDDRAYIHGPIQPENRVFIKRMLMEVARALEIDLREVAEDLDEFDHTIARMSLQ